MLPGVPRMCMRMRPAPDLLTIRPNSGSKRRALMSLIMSAPASITARATGALYVSTEIGISVPPRISLTTGKMRSSSASTDTG